MTFCKSLLFAAACIAGAEAFSPASSLPALRSARTAACAPIRMGGDHGHGEEDMSRREVEFPT